MTNLLSDNSKRILKERYLLKNEKGETIESIDDMFWRVANTVASVEEEKDKYTQEFYDILSKLYFLPNSPTYMNAGTELGYLSACTVLPVPDTMEGIFDAVKKASLVNKYGAGTGFSFSRLRPKGDVVGSTGGVSSGAVSFINTFNTATDTVKQGGRRKGANMGVLRIDHPDILDFIEAKNKLNDDNKEIYNLLKDSLNNKERLGLKKKLLSKQFSNFNLSVAITDKFMEAVKNKEEYELINPRNDEVWGTLYAPEIWDKICKYAYENAEPGLVFLDEINRQHPLHEEIEAVNVCGTW